MKTETDTIFRAYEFLLTRNSEPCRCHQRRDHFDMILFTIIIKVQPTKPIALHANGLVPGLAKRDVGMQNSGIRLSRHANLIDGVLASKTLSISSVLHFTFCKSLGLATLGFSCHLVSLRITVKR